MQQRFGAAFTNVAFGRKGANSKFMNEFEFRKRAFGALNPNHDIAYRLTLVFNPKRSEFYDEDTYEVLLARYYCPSKQLFTPLYQSSLLTPYRADMKSLFDPVVENVIALLKQQIKASNASDGVIIKVCCHALTPLPLADQADYYSRWRLRLVALSPTKTP